MPARYQTERQEWSGGTGTHHHPTPRAARCEIPAAQRRHWAEMERKDSFQKKLSKLIKHHQQELSEREQQLNRQREHQKAAAWALWAMLCWRRQSPGVEDPADAGGWPERGARWRPPAETAPWRWGSAKKAVELKTTAASILRTLLPPATLPVTTCL